MQDKEFDELFRKKFEGFEAQPSGDLWNFIQKNLDDKKPAKRKLPVFRLAAASVVLVIGLAYWLSRTPRFIALHPDPVVKVSEPVKPVLQEQESMPQAAQKAKKPVLLVKTESHENVQLRTAVASKNSKFANRTLTAVIQEKPSDSSLLKVTSVSNGTALSEDITIDQTINKSPVLAAVSDNELLKQENKTEGSSQIRSIRSAGDLVNFVVGKVDKRKDKIIQFKDTDEGPLLTGLNLGFIKFKSRN